MRSLPPTRGREASMEIRLRGRSRVSYQLISTRGQHRPGVRSTSDTEVGGVGGGGGEGGGGSSRERQLRVPVWRALWCPVLIAIPPTIPRTPSSHSGHQPPALLAKADGARIPVVLVQRATSGLAQSGTPSTPLAASKAWGRESRHLSSLKKLR